MQAWLLKRWDDIRGNFIWWILATVFTTAGSVRAFFWQWYSSLTVPVRILSACIFLESVACVALGVLLVQARKRSIVTIRDSAGNERTPAMLLPREHPAQKKKQPTLVASEIVGALTIEELGVIHEVIHGSGGGVQLRLKNVGLKPLKTCRLTVVSFAKYHETKQEFRQPNFTPNDIIKVENLEPDEVSGEAWLARLVDGTKTLRIPTGKLSGYGDTREGGVWKAMLNVAAGAAIYSDWLFVQWTPGELPTILPGDSFK
jgi:hypothetical protein